jgi:hypothetical protein
VTAIPYRGDVEWPAFPAVRIKVRGAAGLHEVNVWAKIDTGASRTIVPFRLLEQVGAYRLPRRTAACKGYDGTRRVLPMYEVDLFVEDPGWPAEVGAEFESAMVLAVGDGNSDGACEVLLGRDILAAWHLHLDGRNSRYTVT